MRTQATILAIFGAILLSGSLYKVYTSPTPIARNNFQNFLTTKTQSSPKTESGDILYTANAQGEIMQWSISSQTLTATLPNVHHQMISNLQVTSDNKLLISTDMQGNIFTWSIATGTVLNKVTGIFDNTEHASCSVTKDSKYLFCGGFPGKIKKYSLETNTQVLDLGQVFEDLNPQSQLPQSCIWTMATTPDNLYLFSSNEFGHLKQFSVKDGSVVKDYGIVHSDSLSSLSVTPNGKYLFTSSISGEFKKWDISEQKLVKDFGVIYPKGKNWIFAIMSSWDSENIFVSSSDWTTGLMSQWSISDEKMINDYGTVFGKQSFRALAVSKDGKYVFGASDRGNLKQYLIADKSLVKDYGAVGKEESLNYGIYTMAVA